jgi:pyrroloquinoline quinone (PQQ) biosynthesis protein C
MRLTEATSLSTAFVEEVRPSMAKVTEHEFFRKLSDATASLEQCRRALLGFYPLVEAFPRYMKLTLDKLDADERPRADEARVWLRANIRTEGRHASWWRDWGQGFGISREDFARARVSEAMDAPPRYLLEVATNGSATEAIAAVNYAVEGATGVWTRFALPAHARLGQGHGFALDERALRWLRAHADYDDRHPVEALEIVKALATDEPSRAAAAQAAIKSLGYFEAALDDALAA